MAVVQQGGKGSYVVWGTAFVSQFVCCSAMEGGLTKELFVVRGRLSSFIPAMSTRNSKNEKIPAVVEKDGDFVGWGIGVGKGTSVCAALRQPDRVDALLPQPDQTQPVCAQIAWHASPEALPLRAHCLKTECHNYDAPPLPTLGGMTSVHQPCPHTWVGFFPPRRIFSASLVTLIFWKNERSHSSTASPGSSVFIPRNDHVMIISRDEDGGAGAATTPLGRQFSNSSGNPSRSFRRGRRNRRPCRSPSTSPSRRRR